MTGILSPPQFFSPCNSNIFFAPQIKFRLGIWISIIQFGQDLARSYYLILGASLWTKISFVAKFKMAAAAIMENYKIGHNLKTIQVNDPNFSRPMFSRVRNVLKLSFPFYDHSNYLKFKMAAIWVDFWLFRLKHLFVRHNTLV